MCKCPLGIAIAIVDKELFADCRFLVSVAIDNLSVLSEFILIFCAISMISIHTIDSFEIIDDQYFSDYQVLVSSTFHARSESSRVRIWVCYVTTLRSFYFVNCTVPSPIEMIA
jgi:hypothetical protein